MKLVVKKITLSILLAGVFSVASAAELNRAELERNLRSTLNIQQARVQITLDWEKEVRMRDLMRRPIRGSQSNPVVEIKKKRTSCRGMLLEGNTRVALPAVCLEEDDFTLKQIHLLFSNQQKAVGTGRSAYVKGDMGYVVIKQGVVSGIQGMPFSQTREGQTLQETYGSAMTAALHEFFTSFGVRFKAPRCRVGSFSRGRVASTLKIGEPIVFKGKLVALVKEVPRVYGTIFGKVSESSLAVFDR